MSGGVTLNSDMADEAKGMERLAYFSDAVFAIAITLLSVNISLPMQLTQAQLVAWLLAQHPKLAAYAIGYITIGVYWLSHYRMFRYIKRGDSILRKLNLFFLIGITAIPFLASFIVAYHHLRLAVVLYASIQTLISLLCGLIWIYAAPGHRLLDPELDADTIRGVYFRDFSPAFIFLLSILLAFVNHRTAQLFWLLVAFVPILSRRCFPHEKRI